MRLFDLQVGQKGTIQKVLAQNATIFRLLEMGLIVGSLVEMIRRGPQGSPLQILVGDSFLCLRKEEALLFEIALESSQIHE